MSDPLSDHMNARLREARAGLDINDHDAINAAIREAAGRPAAPQQQRPGRDESGEDPRPHPGRRLLAEATEGVRNSEPVPGIHTERQWDQWAHSKPVLHLLDGQGRLPGESGYRPTTTAAALGSAWDYEGALAARRQRWKNLGR